MQIGLYILVLLIFIYFGTGNRIKHVYRGSIRLLAFLLTMKVNNNVGYLLNCAYDFIDCVPGIEQCPSREYQTQDKLMDNIVRLYYLIQKPYWYLWLAYIWRTIGEILFFANTIDRRHFIIFPDLYQVLYFADVFDHSRAYLSLATAAKMAQEYKLHYKNINYESSVASSPLIT